MDSVEKEVQVGRVAARGASHLFVGRAVSSLLGLVGSVLVIRLLDPNSYGLISVAMIVPGLFLILGDFGVSSAVIRSLAASGQSSETKSRVGTALTFDFILGILLMLVCIGSSAWLTNSLFGKPQAAGLAALASLTVLANTLYTGVWSVLIGLDATRWNATMLVISNSVQTVVAPMLVVLGLGPAGAIYGYVFAPFSAALLGAIFLVRRSKVGMASLQDLKAMISFGMPLAAGAALTAVQGQLYNVLMAAFASAESIGNFSAATKFTVVNELALLPITTVLFPAFAKLRRSESRRIDETFQSSVIYSSLLIVPIGFGTIALSKSLSELIIGANYSSAWLFLSLNAAAWLYGGLGSPIMNPLLVGQGETKVVFYLSIVNALVSSVVGLVLIPSMGALGVPIASLLSVWPQYLLGLRFLRARLGAHLPVGKLARLFLASFVATAPSFALGFTRVGATSQITLGVIMAIPLYAVVVPRLGVLDANDMSNLIDLLSPIPVAGSVARRVLGILKRFLSETPS